MRVAYYAGVSGAAAAACLLKAFHQRPNFYSATVYLSQSNACLLILTNLLLVVACSFMYALQRLLYGPLRPIEIEQLSEKAWYAVLDTLLAMPSFREDVGGWLLAMFVLLLAGKVWGWIGEGRVDILEQQPPANPKLFHARLATSLILSVVFDLYMFDYCVETVLADPRPGMMVIFTFEFAVLAVFSIFTLCRYCLSLAEARILSKQTQEAIEIRKGEIRAERAAARQNDTANSTPAPAPSATEDPIHVDEEEIDVPGWEEKRRFLFFLEVVTDFLKLMIYIVFFTISITFNGLPMHIMRDVYMTFAGFTKRVNDYIAYRKATSDMNTRYPDATTEEIRGDACIVCRESMVAWTQDPSGQEQARPAGHQPSAAPPFTRRRDEGLRAKKLPCGHILHLRCLKAWLERQQVCPTCRRPVVSSSTPSSTGQPGANGANGAAPGQQGQQGQGRAQRPNGARIFNLGPIRIGFLNGPGDQIQNIVQQMRNQPAAAQNGANAQGPNHLGLRVPYAAPGTAGAPRPGQATAGSTSTQADLMSIEQRLITEAHNLGVEQQQLVVLRAMEGELARLRANVVPGQQPVGTAITAQGHMPGMHPPFPSQIGTQPIGGNHFQRSEAETLHGTGQSYGSGYEHLPQGMTVPEGWNVMPLQRAAPISAPAGSVSAPAGEQVTDSAPGPPTNEAPTTPHVAAPQNASTTVPTNGNGSPLFVASDDATSNEQATSQSQSTVVNGQSILQPQSQPAPTNAANHESETTTQPVSQTPWQTSASNWNFPEEANGPAATTEGVAAPPQPSEAANPAPKQKDSSGASAKPSNQNYEGKGKGRAVEVEDVPDSEK